MAGLIGWPELIIILVIVVLIFGAGRIRELARSLGEGVKEYKKATNDTAETKVNNDDAIKEAAAKMGIKTEGKTSSQLLEEMKSGSS